MTSAELASLVRDLEDCTLPRKAWTHAAHLSVAVWHLLHYPRDEATKRIRAGIQRYNASLGNTAGYHETVTLAWIAILAHFLQESPAESAAGELAAEAVKRFGAARYLSKYFSNQLLFSDLARKEWVEPDLASLDDLLP